MIALAKHHGIESEIARCFNLSRDARCLAPDLYAARALRLFCALHAMAKDDAAPTPELREIAANTPDCPISEYGFVIHPVIEGYSAARKVLFAQMRARQ